MNRMFRASCIVVVVAMSAVWTGCGVESVSDEVSLNVLVGHWTVGHDNSPFEAAKKELERRHPGLSVVFDVQQGGGNVRSKFLTSAAAGEMPDVAMVDSVALGEFAEAGLLTDISPFAAEWDEWEDIFENFREAGSWDGVPHGVFLNTDLRVFVWNRRHFKEVGLDPDIPPTSWDEILEYAEILNDPPRRYAMMLPGGSSEHLPHRWYSFLWGAGGEILDSDGRVAFNSPEGGRAAGFYRTLIEKEFMPIDVLSTSADDNDRALASGSYAMGVVGSWFFNFAREVGIRTPEEFNEKFGVSAVPGPDGGVAPSGAGGWTVVLPQGARHPELAWEFIAIAMGIDNHRMWALSQGNVPVRESLASESAFFEMLPFYGVIQEMLPNARTRPSVPGYPTISSELQGALQAIMLGELGVEGALDRAVENANQEMGL
ncbi:extracellular solute-binding protein [Alkalispirochaeta alkalica]|uniref:extracellular solute-binding protein n=1 Tax=Alkalispirochaeta alkalica TaxID=46356 RepID=UPI0003A26C9C|nr:ABC transporter substrate-binding protein [Alkalispirochaeta alkalica]